MTENQDALPVTVEQAVRLLQWLVPAEEQAKIAAMVEEDLKILHFGLGQWVRNHLGLWSDNSVLLLATGAANADDASDAVIMAFWTKLKNKLITVH